MIMKRPIIFFLVCIVALASVQAEPFAEEEALESRVLENTADGTEFFIDAADLDAVEFYGERDLKTGKKPQKKRNLKMQWLKRMLSKGGKGKSKGGRSKSKGSKGKGGRSKGGKGKGTSSSKKKGSCDKEDLPEECQCAGIETWCKHRTCRVRMNDNKNDFDAILTVKKLNRCNKFVVTTVDNLSNEDGWSVDVETNATHVIADAGVPVPTCDQLKVNWPMEDNSQLTWFGQKKHPCTEFESSLIFFMVLEWFYYG